MSESSKALIVPNLQAVTSAQLTKADLLELVKAEEENRLNEQLKQIGALIQETENKIEKIKAKIIKENKDKVTAMVKASSINETSFEILHYDNWAAYSSKQHRNVKLSKTPVTILKAEFKGYDSEFAFKTEIELRVSDKELLAELEKRDKLQKQIPLVQRDLQEINKKISQISAGITRKALESSNPGKQILDLLRELRYKTFEIKESV